MKPKRIGEYVRRGIRVKAKQPKLMYKDNEYDMELGDDGFYTTTYPLSRVPKIGVKKPNKIKYTQSQLRNMGYKPKKAQVE